MQRRFGAPGLAMTAMAMCAAALAAERTPQYPSKPIRLIIPFAPGGGADLTARLIGPRLHERLGQPVVYDNRPAAAGIIGAEIAAKSVPDGHTLLIATSSFAANPSIYRKLPYDILRDLTPITLAVSSPLVVIVHPSLPAKTMQDLIAYAKANPNKLNYGSSGAGGPPHIAGEMLKSMAKIEMAHVVYKGIAPVLTALLGNEVQLSFGNIFVSQPHVRAGRLRALAITSAQRSQAAPDWPTVAESGLPGYETAIWYGFMAPSGTPKSVVARLNGEIVRILQLPEVSQGIVAQGGDVVASTPDAFGKRLRADIDKLAGVIKTAGIKPE
jgi:tripartite-type tricarboxylate transporter receptor subunit TctC